jgi:hypothetical protein
VFLLCPLWCLFILWGKAGEYQFILTRNVVFIETPKGVQEKLVLGDSGNLVPSFLDFCQDFPGPTFGCYSTLTTCPLSVHSYINIFEGE